MSIIRPAATVLVIRHHAIDGMQVLLLKRNPKLQFAPGYWVFPGGRIDPADGSLKEEYLGKTARQAAAREAFEEAKITLDPSSLTHFCHWTTPAGGNRRFSTWFFLGFIGENQDEVKIDRSEIVDHIWIHPNDALQSLSNGQLHLLPPTFITLQRIKTASSYKEVKEEFARTGVVNAAPVTISSNGKFYCLYQGDSGYESSDITLTASRHRLIIDQANGLYHFEYDHCTFPPVNGGVLF